MAQQAESESESETGSKCEQSFVTTVDVGKALLAPKMGSVAVLGTGATANQVRFSSLVSQSAHISIRATVPLRW